MRALGFCVSVEHADSWRELFTERGHPGARRVRHDTGARARRRRSRKLRDRRSQRASSRSTCSTRASTCPTVDTVLFLRPTESATVFLQQLGRGLRHADGKACLRCSTSSASAPRFRFDGATARSSAAGSAPASAPAVEEGFPLLPAGCDIQLDRVAQRGRARERARDRGAAVGRAGHRTPRARRPVAGRVPRATRIETRGSLPRDPTRLDGAPAARAGPPSGASPRGRMRGALQAALGANAPYRRSRAARGVPRRPRQHGGAPGREHRRFQRGSRASERCCISTCGRPRGSRT